MLFISKVFLVKNEAITQIEIMGCFYSKVEISGPLRPIKAWKMDFSEYERELNENDLDDLRTVILL